MSQVYVHVVHLYRGYELERYKAAILLTLSLTAPKWMFILHPGGLFGPPNQGVHTL